MKRSLVIGFVFILVMIGVVSAVEYPEPFIVENSPDVAIIYGTNSGISTLELVTAGNIQTDLSEKSNFELGEVLAPDTSLDSLSSKNLIILGTIGDDCSNNALITILGKENCNEVVERVDLKAGEFLIEVVSKPDNENKIALLLIGYQVAELVEAGRYLKSNTVSTFVGARYKVGSTTTTPIDTCIDSDGLNYYEKGKVTWIYEQETTTETIQETYVYEDECESSTRIKEYVCDGDNYKSSEMVCPNGCQDGACIEDDEDESELSKIVGTVQLIYEDFVTTSALNVVELGNIQTWLKGRGLKSEIKKNSEINNNFMKDKVTVFIHDGKAVVIYGEYVTSTLSIVEAGNIKSRLMEGGKIELLCKIIKSDYVESDDLKDYLCKEEYVPKPILLVYDDDYISTLDLVILGELQTWLKEKNIESEMKKNSEINNNFLEDRVTVFAYNRETIVIYGKDVSSALDLVSAGNIQTHFMEDKSGRIMLVCPELIESSDINSNDLKDYLCKEILNPVDEDPIEIPDENKYLCGACKLDSKCYPLGYRKSGEYCSEDLEFIEQSNAEDFCDNNFECKSNVCVSGECVSEGMINKILNWFRRVFGSE